MHVWILLWSRCWSWQCVSKLEARRTDLILMSQNVDGLIIDSHGWKVANIVDKLDGNNYYVGHS